MPNKTLDFPQELLLKVKEYFEPWDLRTNVCFYVSSPRVAALYDDSKDAELYWETACWVCGIGAHVDDWRLEVSEEDAFPPWKAIAIDCISRDGFCTHPQCGEALLEHNRERMREAAEYVQPRQVLRIGENRNGVYLEPHRLFGHIEFKRDASSWPRPKVEQDAHLRAPGVPARRIEDPRYSQKEDYAGLYLWQHPLAARTFATTPPISNIMLLHLGGRRIEKGIMDLPRAITVFDVVEAVHAELDHVLCVYEAADHIHMHEECIPKDWTHGMVFNMAQSVRRILTLCPVKGLEYEECTELGPAFSFDQM